MKSDSKDSTLLQRIKKKKGFKQQINILDGLLKDHVTLQTEVMILSISYVLQTLHFWTAVYIYIKKTIHWDLIRSSMGKPKYTGVMTHLQIDIFHQAC